MKVYIDSDILISHLRGVQEAYNLIKRLRDKERFSMWIGAMQRAEVVFFMKLEEEEKTRLLLNQFQTAPVDHSIVDMAATLYRQWGSSHGTNMNDAFLAATAIQTNSKLFTMNPGRYPMPNLDVEKGW